MDAPSINSACRNRHLRALSERFLPAEVAHLGGLGGRCCLVWSCAVATAHEKAADHGDAKDPLPWFERIRHPTVLIEDRIATVWARDDFHKGSNFTHNGTDCYTLLKTDAGWRNAGLVFTIEPGPTTKTPPARRAE